MNVPALAINPRRRFPAVLSHRTRHNPPVKVGPPPVRPPDALPFDEPDDSAGPIHAFTRLVDALHERDQAGADEARRELRRRGFNVIPIGTPKTKKGGRACPR